MRVSGFRRLLEPLRHGRSGEEKPAEHSSKSQNDARLAPGCLDVASP